MFNNKKIWFGLWVQFTTQSLWSRFWFLESKYNILCEATPLPPKMWHKTLHSLLNMIRMADKTLSTTGCTLLPPVQKRDASYTLVTWPRTHACRTYTFWSHTMRPLLYMVLLGVTNLASNSSYYIWPYLSCIFYVHLPWHGPRQSYRTGSLACTSTLPMTSKCTDEMCCCWQDDHTFDVVRPLCMHTLSLIAQLSFATLLDIYVWKLTMRRTNRVGVFVVSMANFGTSKRLGTQHL